MQKFDLGTKVGKESFNTEIFVVGERSLEELNKKLEELQKGTENDILEFVKRMNARWNELRESRHENLFGIESQSNSTKEVLVHEETKEKSIEIGRAHV